MKAPEGTKNPVLSGAHSDATSSSPLTIAVPVRWHNCVDRFGWVTAHGFAAAYSPNPNAIAALPSCVNLLLDAGVSVRYHGFFPDHEIGHRAPAVAEHALQVQMAALEAIRGRGEQIITTHVGLKQTAPLDHGRAVENLARLVERGRELGITVCLENLRTGPTSHPELLLSWVEASGAMITLDVGHALSCRHVQEEELSVSDFIDAFDERIEEVHYYESETDRHNPPQDMSILGPIVDRLLKTRCTWWTIELDDCAEALSTRALLLDYLQSSQKAANPTHI